MVERYKIFFLFLFIFVLTSTKALALSPSYLYLQADKAIDYGQKNILLGFLWAGNSKYSPALGINGATIFVLERKKGATNWNILVSGQTQSIKESGVTYNGFYGYEDKPLENTEYSTFFEGDTNYEGAQTNVVTTLVRARVRLKAKRNENKKIISFNGKLIPDHLGKAVILKIKKKDNKFWHSLARLKTNSKSDFKYNWHYQSGTYYFKAIFKSDSDHAAGTSKLIKINI